MFIGVHPGTGLVLRQALFEDLRAGNAWLQAPFGDIRAGKAYRLMAGVAARGILCINYRLTIKFVALSGKSDERRRSI